MSEFPWADYTDEVDYATYDPDDDKIRIYSGHVPREMYDALKEARFNRAYKQECFYAKWYPWTEDIALALCDEISDEDSTIFDRAEDRSTRFAIYSGNAEKRAEQAIRAGDAAVEGIPFGQPILVGHHSERKHRKAVERAQREADKMVEEVDRRDYWAYRARAVKRHVNRTFDRGVVMRRVKKLESEKRKKESEREGKDYNRALTWFVSDLADEYPDDFTKDGLTAYQGKVVIAAAWAQKRIVLEGMSDALRERLQKWQTGRERYCDRWIAHLEGQISYWKTLLEDKHNEDIDQQMPLKKGDWIRCPHGWAQIERVNKGAEKRITSVSVDRETATWNKPGGWFYPRKVDYESVKEHRTSEEYQAMTYAEQNAAEIARLEREAAVAVKRREAQEADGLRQVAETRKEAADAVEVRVNYNPNFYPTPISIVNKMLDAADIRVSPGVHVSMLEPSAGDGRIIKAALEREPDLQVRYCEVNHEALQVLGDIAGPVIRIGCDFLGLDGWEEIFDYVIGNPPWNDRVYIAHTKKAYECLKPGGRMVWLLPSASFWSDNNNRFHNWLLDVDADSECLPDDTFSVKSRIVVIDKPKQVKQASLF